MHQVLLKQKRL